MIRQLLLTALVLVAGMSSGAAQNVTIKGTVNGLADGDLIEFVPISHDNSPALAWSKVFSGKFETALTVDQPYGVHVKINHCYTNYVFMINVDDNIVLNIGNAEKVDYGNFISYTLSGIDISGSFYQKRYEDLMKSRENLDDIREKFMKKYKDIMEKEAEMRKKKDDDGLKSILESAEYKTMSEEDNEFFNTVQTTYAKIFEDNKDSFWGPMMLLNLTSYLSPDMKKYYEAFSDEAKNSYFGKKVHEELWPKGGKGNKIPDFTLTDETGKSYTFADLIKGKKYLLIDFWASWCAPCRREIPNVKANYETYKDKGFEVVSISIDQKTDAWKKAVEQEQMQWPNFLDQKMAEIFKVKAVPTMYLVDETGVIVAENEEVRGDNLGNLLKTLF